MCETRPDRDWNPVGATTWKGGLFVLELCIQCGSYRARKLDVDNVDVVQGEPELEPSEDTMASEPEDGSDGVEDDDWLID